MKCQSQQSHRARPSCYQKTDAADAWPQVNWERSRDLGDIELVQMMRKGQAKYACNSVLSLAEQFELVAA